MELWYLTTPDDGLVITDSPEQYESELTWMFPLRDPAFMSIDALERWLEACRRVGQPAMYDIGGEIASPAVTVKAPIEVERSGRNKLCPYCKQRNVLITLPGGFKSCTDSECKTQALDEAMEAELGVS